jgi:hypothetical protein
MDAVYIGSITAVYPPTHSNNSNKYQYEYTISLTGELFSQTPIPNCIKADVFGGLDDFDDAILSVGNAVLVSFPHSEFRCGIIIGCIRNHKKKMEIDRRVHWRQRFNKTEMTVDKAFNWSIKSDYGPSASVMVDKIILDDSMGQKITLDKNTKTITISAETWTVNILKNANITVGGDLTAAVTGKASLQVTGDATVAVTGMLNASVAKDATIDIKGNANLKVAMSLNAEVKNQVNLKCKELNAKVEGDAKVEAAGKIEVKGSTIELNGSMGEILTTLTMPVVDMITGTKSVGVPNVKAG